MIRVISIDDHKIFRDGIRAILDKENDIEIVDEASDGKEAINLAKKYNPDIMLMDISIPYINGIEATKQIKIDNPDIKIIILSMHHANNWVIQAFKAGASGYVTKDTSCSELVGAIKTVNLGKQHACAQVSDVLVSFMLRQKV